jgi:hypothetical protein
MSVRVAAMKKAKSYHTTQHAKILSFYVCTSEKWEQQHFIISCPIHEVQFPNKELPRETQPKSCSA